MKKIISCFVGCMVCINVFAAPSGRGRVSMSDQMMGTSRAIMSKNQISAMGTTNSKSSTGVSAVATGVGVPDVSEQEIVKDMREKERTACISNNVGVGNTFVWASRFSNLNDYASMVEDVVEPENNTCFVKVELKSQDERIDLADVPAKYFEVGRNIECGTWVDQEQMRQRILDGKKKARVWGTVGAVVGGAGIGVGAMELFGNRLIKGKVEGQAGLGEEQQRRSQLLVLQEKNQTEYNNVIVQLRILKENCTDYITNNNATAKAVCDKYSALIEEFVK